MVQPKLSDIELVRFKFSPGDRILARVSVDLTSGQIKKIERAVVKMAGEHVRVLVIDVRRIKLVRVRMGAAESLTGFDSENSTKPRIGRVDLSCSAVDFELGDTLVALVPFNVDRLQLEKMTQYLRHWTGPDIEVRIEQVDIDRSQKVSGDVRRRVTQSLSEENGGVRS